MLKPIDPINQAECGGGQTIESVMREYRRKACDRHDERARRAACFDELLAALKSLLTVSLPGDVSGERIIANARAAIAKADGAKGGAR